MKENYLERIAIALETLVAQGNSLNAEFDVPAPTLEVAQPVTITEKQDDSENLREILKSELLKVGQAGKKEMARGVLTSMGCKKLSEIADSDLASTIAKVKALL